MRKLVNPTSFYFLKINVAYTTVARAREFSEKGIDKKKSV